MFVMAFPNWSCDLDLERSDARQWCPPVWLPVTVEVKASLLGGAGVTVNDVVAAVTPVCVVSVAVMV